MGDTAAADMEQWPLAIRKLEQFPAHAVVPGHGERLDQDYSSTLWICLKRSENVEPYPSPVVPAAFGRNELTMMQSLQQASLRAVFLALLFCAAGCSRTAPKGARAFLDKLSHGPESELGACIYGYSDASPDVRKVLLDAIRPLRAPSPDQHMTIEASRSAGHFTMLCVRVPWPQPTQREGDQADFQPIIICHEKDRDLLVGYVLPFDDILIQFQGPDMGDIIRLSDWWIQNHGKR